MKLYDFETGKAEGLPASAGERSDFFLGFLGSQGISKVFDGDPSSPRHGNVKDIPDKTTEKMTHPEGNDPDQGKEGRDHPVFEELGGLRLLSSPLSDLV